jgi:hypothetical protein
MRPPYEHPSDPLDPKAPLSLTEQRVFGVDAVRCPTTGRVFEQGSGALPHAEQTRHFIREAEIAKREAEQRKQEAAQLAAAPKAVPARRRGAEPA